MSRTWMTRRPRDPASPQGERAAKSRPKNHVATAAHGFAVIGLTERTRNRARPGAGAGAAA